MYKDINVSESTVRNIFKDFNILPPRAWKSSRKKLKKLLMVNDFAVDDAAIFSSVDDFMDMDPHPSTPRKRYAGNLFKWMRLLSFGFMVILFLIAMLLSIMLRGVLLGFS